MRYVEMLKFEAMKERLADFVVMPPLSRAIEKGASLEEVKVFLDANREAASTAGYVRR